MGAYAKAMAKANEKLLLKNPKKKSSDSNKLHLIASRGRRITIPVDVEPLDHGNWSDVFLHPSGSVVVVPRNKNKVAYFSSGDASKLLLAEFNRRENYLVTHLPDMRFFGGIVYDDDTTGRGAKIKYNDKDIHWALYSPVYIADLYPESRYTRNMSAKAKKNMKEYQKIGKIIMSWACERLEVPYSDMTKVSGRSNLKYPMQYTIDGLRKEMKKKLSRSTNRKAKRVLDDLQGLVDFVTQLGVAQWFNLDLCAPQNFAFNSNGELIMLDPLYPLKHKRELASQRLGSSREDMETIFGNLLWEREEFLLDLHEKAK